MTYIKSGFQALLAVASLALAFSGSVQAQVSRDSQEINSYVLTEAGVARFAKASEALGKIRDRMPSDCDDSEDSDDSDAKNIDEMVAKMNAIPGAKAAIASGGMTTREYFVFSMSLFQTGMASWALSQPGGKLPPGISMANVNFYRQHEAAMSKMAESSKGDDCDAGDREDDPTE